MKLAIILPAYNEEKAVESVIENTLKAKDKILSSSPVNEIEVIVVDDGSTDNTKLLASKWIPNIKLISYPVNRGYGYAIKMGFDSTDAGLVSFFDVDGTCSPEFLSELANLLVKSDADLALGSRLGPLSQMPFLRKFLNRILSLIVNIFSDKSLIDMASGMRMIKKSSLAKIYPLPDGLNFTPAMSTRAAIDKRIKIVEKDMPYFERVGTSKLSVFKDGFRFLWAIFDILITYKPIYFFFIVSSSLILVSALYGYSLLEFYLKNRMIGTYYHRLSAIIIFILASSYSMILGLILQKAVNIITKIYEESRLEKILNTLLVKSSAVISILFVTLGVYINKIGIYNYFLTGYFKIHWLNITVGGLFILLGMQFISLKLFDKILNLLLEKEKRTTLK